MKIYRNLILLMLETFVARQAQKQPAVACMLLLEASDLDGQVLGEAQEGEGDWIVVLRELPVEPLHQVVKENRNLQLRQLRSRA